MSKQKQLTLADCNPDRKPDCFHCGKRLPKSARIQVEPEYIIVHCAGCCCMTPFKRTGTKDHRRRA